METISEWKILILESLQNMGDAIASILPSLIGAVVILIGGWLITKVILSILRKILSVTKIDKLTDKINETGAFGTTDVKFKVSKVILGFVKLILFLVFLIIAVDIMKWDIVSVEIGNLLRYLPKLFSAVALIMIGLYVATYIRKGVQSLFESFALGGAKLISNLIFYVILVFVAITALNQAGVDTTIITNNITLILGAFLLAVAIGFGLGSKEVIGDLLRTFYTRKNFMIGDHVKIKEVEGTIESIDNICVIVKTKSGKTVIPIKKVVNSKVEIVS
ncbi:MAG: mechanosensitive ion channel domain-containing protein [Cellulophaga sp.]